MKYKTVWHKGNYILIVLIIFKVNPLPPSNTFIYYGPDLNECMFSLIIFILVSYTKIYIFAYIPLQPTSCQTVFPATNTGVTSMHC